MTYSLNDINIQLFKLSSGDEIISLVYEEPEGILIGLESPLLLHIKVSAESHSYAFSDWIPMAKNRGKVNLNPSHVISQAEADDEIKERYIRMCLRMREEEDSYDDDDLEEDSLRDDQLELFSEMIPKKVSIH
jgi:hypothetical protein